MLIVEYVMGYIASFAIALTLAVNFGARKKCALFIIYERTVSAAALFLISLFTEVGGSEVILSGFLGGSGIILSLFI